MRGLPLAISWCPWKFSLVVSHSLNIRGQRPKRHVAYLVLQLLDPIDMCILILENVFQYLPCSKVVGFSGELDCLIVGLDGTQLERVIAGKLFGCIRSNRHPPEFVDDRCSLEEEDPADKFLGVFHLVDGAFFKMLV